MVRTKQQARHATQKSTRVKQEKDSGAEELNVIHRLSFRRLVKEIAEVLQKTVRFQK